MAAARTDADVPPHARGVEGGRIIVGVDDTPGGVAALRCAVALARARRAQLVAVRAWGLGLPRHGGWRHNRSGRGHLVVGFAGMMPRELAGELARRALRSAAGGTPGELDVAIETPEGNPGPLLTKIACPGDVLVVGTAGRRSLKRVVHGSARSAPTAPRIRAARSLWWRPGGRAGTSRIRAGRLRPVTRPRGPGRALGHRHGCVARWLTSASPCITQATSMAPCSRANRPRSGLRLARPHNGGRAPARRLAIIERRLKASVRALDAPDWADIARRYRPEG